MFRSVLAGLVLLLVLLPTPGRAQWQQNGTVISSARLDQQYPLAVSDGAGGAIMTWMDYRAGATVDLYAQRINAQGVVQWTADGVAICTAASNQLAPAIIADGSGGAIIAWQDLRNGTYDIYAQRINAAGGVLWTANGVAICVAAGDQQGPALVTDAAAGAIISWTDLRAGNTDIYSRRVNSVGVVQWAADGVAIATGATNQLNTRIAIDGAGGAIITWQDYRNSTYDIFAQRITGAGAVQWVANGVALCLAAFDQQVPVIITDGAGGAIAAWQDARGTILDIYAQRINSSGVVQWAADGAAVTLAAGNQQSAVMVPDGGGGAIVTWTDNRNGGLDVYAQRMSSAGVPQWTTNGVSLCTAGQDQNVPAISADGSGGALVTWTDFRSGVNFDVYAQRISNAGAPQWTADGVVVSAAQGAQVYPTVVADATGGALVAWHDNRNGANYDIFAERVDSDFGAWGNPEPLVTSVTDVPNDQGGKVAVNWKRSGHDILTLQEISYYSVWRAVNAVSALAAVSNGQGWTDPSKIGADFHGHAVSRETIAGTDYYWEWVANQGSTHDAGYSLSAATRADSVAGNTATHYFRVLAQTANAYVLYKSNVVSGHSVDNLAPGAPLLLTAQRIGNYVHLKWNGVHVSDLGDYAVYRKTSAGVTPVPVNFLSNAADTVLTDTSPPASAVYYIVTAIDVHANEGKPSNEAAVAAATGTGNLPPVTTLTVLQNRPNPFATGATFDMGLPLSSSVEVSVFDVAGRKVATHALGVKPAGWQTIALEARDDAGHALASGVYFYRITAAGSTVTRKMVIAR